MLARLPKGREEIFKKTIDFACRDRCYIFLRTGHFHYRWTLQGHPLDKKQLMVYTSCTSSFTP
jgi:hypothetical protein